MDNNQSNEKRINTVSAKPIFIVNKINQKNLYHDEFIQRVNYEYNILKDQLSKDYHLLYFVDEEPNPNYSDVNNYDVFFPNQIPDIELEQLLELVENNLKTKMLLEDKQVITNDVLDIDYSNPEFWVPEDQLMATSIPLAKRFVSFDFIQADVVPATDPSIVAALISNVKEYDNMSTWADKVLPLNMMDLGFDIYHLQNQPVILRFYLDLESIDLLTTDIIIKHFLNFEFQPQYKDYIQQYRAAVEYMENPQLDPNFEFPAVKLHWKELKGKLSDGIDKKIAAGVYGTTVKDFGDGIYNFNEPTNLKITPFENAIKSVAENQLGDDIIPIVPQEEMNDTHKGDIQTDVHGDAKFIQFHCNKEGNIVNYFEIYSQITYGHILKDGVFSSINYKNKTIVTMSIVDYKFGTNFTIDQYMHKFYFTFIGLFMVNNRAEDFQLFIDKINHINYTVTIDSKKINLNAVNLDNSNILEKMNEIKDEYAKGFKFNEENGEVSINTKK